jgi:hypothetical protein
MNRKFSSDLFCDACGVSSCENPNILEQDICLSLIFVVVVLVLWGVVNFLTALAT